MDAIWNYHTKKHAERAKKNGAPLSPVVNLKSNTMKNTMQR